MTSRKDFSRRKFIKIAGLAGSGTALSAWLAGCAGDAGSPTALSTTASQPSTTMTAPNGPTPTVAAVAPPTTLPAGSPPDGYLLLAPAVLSAGLDVPLSISLFKGESLATDKVQLELWQNSQRVAGVEGNIKGRGSLSLPVPKVAPGVYTLKFQAGSLRDSASVSVKQAGLLLVESDKPVYQPGQSVSLRVLSLNNGLLPLQDEVTVEIADASGAKVFKQSVKTDEYGLTDLEMPLSTEPNLGAWKVSATTKADSRHSSLDFRVEKYTLPKFEIMITPANSNLTPSDAITGTVRAAYTFGKPVSGEFQIALSRATGDQWTSLSTLTKTFDGQGDFEFPAVYASPQDRYRLGATVTEKATGYVETAELPLSLSNYGANLKLVPEAPVFKPGLPLHLLVSLENSTGPARNGLVYLNVSYSRANTSLISSESGQVQFNGTPQTVQLSPPADAVSLTVTARDDTGANPPTFLTLQAAYSPSGAALTVRQTGQAALEPGDTAHFKLTSNRQDGNFYYEVTAQGSLVTGGFLEKGDLELPITPRMSPTARLLVYQILPGGEVVADYLPFAVEAAYTQAVEAAFDKTEVEPGAAVNIDLKTDGPARVGLALVDKAVFILGENRLNVTQVVAAADKLAALPTFEATQSGDSYNYNRVNQSVGTQDLIEGLGMVVISNKTLPRGIKTLTSYPGVAPGGSGTTAAATTAAATTAAATTAASSTTAAPGGATTSSGTGPAAPLAEVKRVRQFFPETWLWETALSDAEGKVSKKLNTPDSITTWSLQALAISPKTGLGMAQAELKVFQPFFVSLDLPYSVIRGERFPVKVAVYNYTEKAEDFVVELERGDWFDLLDKSASQPVKIGANDLAGVSFTIQPRQLGTGQLRITARSTSRADAIVKDLRVEAEGVAREEVQNLLLVAGNSYEIDLGVPATIVSGSARARLSLTGSYMAQTIEGLENLIQMPYGCGEQNMIFTAPNVYVSQYLKETGQAKPDVLARATRLMLTGYQRELTFRRDDGSFSAFGNNDPVGSLWLSAFVLRTFAQARAFIYIDETVQNATRNWLLSQQKSDGSFEPVGFIHDQQLLGGLTGKTALTAFVAAALLEAGDTGGAGRAVAYLEKVVPDTTEPYSLALGAYALQLAKSGQAAPAVQKLLRLAHPENDTLYWGNSQSQVKGSAIVETTGYALLTLLGQGDQLSAGKAARFLVGQRNSLGGWNSTQDTVLGLQALSRYVANAKTAVNARINLSTAEWSKELPVGADNYDVVQLIETQAGPKVKVEITGQGQAILQAVRRYNVPQPIPADQAAFQVLVDYGTAANVPVNSQLTIRSTVHFTPPVQQKAGMTVLEVGLPTGFVALEDTLKALAKQQPRLKRYDLDGRRVQLYLDDMAPAEKLDLEFKAQALYPVKAQPVVSQAYAYYRPEWQGEHLGGAFEILD